MSLPKFGHMYRLTREPETAFGSSGTQITKVVLACSEKYKERETQLFLDAVAFGKTAEMLASFKKGYRIYAFIKLQTEQWEDKNTGQNRYKISGIIESFEFIEPKQDSQNNQQQGGYNQGYQQPAQPQGNQGYNQGQGWFNPPPNDDMPW